ncbi:MAG TPA: MSMEG_4193 family putative phosphomutase [Tessaracoccus flavescens]|uniref:MSMEG_4193 family putative phosphomutase n=1 Tax=Tessaracoccus flavescens TaxID=399497 RepID=A0A921JPW1_9ACTN|nr:MSMEG_4193 family putative phosphomutase [Tessaracoccus flavescens]
MTKVVLIRHGRSTANADGVLAGRAPGVALDETGREQARTLRSLLAGVDVAAAYTSPIQRCRETAELAGFPDATVLDEVSECHYGEWTGAKLADLVSTQLWTDVQERPSQVSFPGGESMRDMFDRTAAALTSIAERHGAGDTVVIFSHGDPIKAMLAHALGLDRDDFQRLHVNPASVSVVDFSRAAPMVLCMNGGGDVAALLKSSTGPVIGGGDVATPH